MSMLGKARVNDSCFLIDLLKILLFPAFEILSWLLINNLALCTMLKRKHIHHFKVPAAIYVKTGSELLLQRTEELVASN